MPVIFVTVGTHEQPFDRLVRAAEALAATHEVVVQVGTSRVPTPRCTASAWLEPHEVGELMDRAHLVVCHAGPATIFEARARGHHPLVVPRCARFGEHVDDHQVQFVRFMGDRLHGVLDPGELAEAVRAHPEVVQRLAWPLDVDRTRSRRFARDLEAVCRRLVGEERAPTATVRDKVRALRMWWKKHE